MQALKAKGICRISMSIHKVYKKNDHFNPQGAMTKLCLDFLWLGT